MRTFICILALTGLSAGLSFEESKAGGQWAWNSNTKIQVLVNSFAVRMRELVDGLNAQPPQFGEWTAIKQLFGDHREGDTTVDENGEEMEREEMSDIRAKLASRLARRSGYLTKEDNLFKKVDYKSRLFQRLFTNVKMGKNADDEDIVESADFKNRELVAKWKQYNGHQVWVFLWNLFNAIVESRTNPQYTPTKFHLNKEFYLELQRVRDEANTNLEYVADKLMEHFAQEEFQKSRFHGKNPWEMDVQNVVFRTEEEYQKQWGLLAFPAKVIKSLSGEMKEAELESDGLDGILNELVEQNGAEQQEGGGEKTEDSNQPVAKEPTDEAAPAEESPNPVSGEKEKTEKVADDEQIGAPDAVEGQPRMEGGGLPTQALDAPNVESPAAEIPAPEAPAASEAAAASEAEAPVAEAPAAEEAPVADSTTEVVAAAVDTPTSEPETPSATAPIQAPDTSNAESPSAEVPAPEAPAASDASVAETAADEPAQPTEVQPSDAPAPEEPTADASTEETAPPDTSA